MIEAQHRKPKNGTLLAKSTKPLMTVFSVPQCSRCSGSILVMIRPWERGRGSCRPTRRPGHKKLTLAKAGGGAQSIEFAPDDNRIDACLKQNGTKHRGGCGLSVCQQRRSVFMRINLASISARVMGIRCLAAGFDIVIGDGRLDQHI